MSTTDYSGHLKVAGQATGKNLIRGNSVATLNQIYQHHNSIPVRNRILNTAKSLQHPSIDIPDQQTEQAKPAIGSIGTNSSSYLNERHLYQQPAPNNNRPPILAQQQQLIQTATVISAGSQPVQIINVARRHKKQSITDSPFGSGSMNSSPLLAGSYLAMQHQQECAPMRTGQWSSEEELSCSSPTNADLGNNAQDVSPIFSARRRSPQLTRNQTLDVQSVATTRSTSPIRQQQLSAETSPTNASSPRRRILPRIDQAQAPIYQSQRQQTVATATPAANVILDNTNNNTYEQQAANSNPLNRAASFKRPRKLPQIPIQQSPQHQQQRNAAVTTVMAAQAPVGVQTKASLSSSSSGSSNSPIQVANLNLINSQAAGLRQFSNTVSSTDRIVQQTYPASLASNKGQLVQQPIELPPGTMAAAPVEVNKIGFINSSSGSAETPSPRSPIVMQQMASRALPASAGFYTSSQQQQSVRPIQAKLSSSSSSNSPGSLNVVRTSGYFTFDQSAVAQTANEQTNFICYSPGGSSSTATNQANSNNMNLSVDAADQQQHHQYAGRGRRLSTCGSGLRANFLMNKQHAISEFTPPRSLESSTSRGSNDGWPSLQQYQQNQQHAKQSSMTNQSSLDASPIRNLIHQNQQRLVTNLNHNQSSEALLMRASSSIAQSSLSATPQASLVPASQQRSSSASNITNRNYSQQQQQQAKALNSIMNEKFKSVSRLTNVRSNGALGLPPRAASATESGPSTQAGGSSLVPGSHYLQQAGKITSAASAIGLINQPTTTTTNFLGSNQSQTNYVPSTASAEPASAVQLSQRRLAPASGVTTAVSIDVYHVGDSMEAADPHEPGHSMDLSASNDFNNLQLLTNPAKQQRSSLVPPPQRDRQPSNVSTNSMPAAVGASNQQQHHNSLMLANSSLASSMQSSYQGGNSSSLSVGDAQRLETAEKRKFGAWAERIANTSSKTSAWIQESSKKKSSGKELTKQSSELTTTSSAENSSSSPDRSSSIDSRASSSSEASLTRLKDNNNGNQLESATAQNNNKLNVFRVKQKRRKSVAARQLALAAAAAASSTSRPKSAAPDCNLSSTTAHHPKADNKGEQQQQNYSDQLTLCDRLKLAERSASKLFRKVEVAPQRQPAKKVSSQDSSKQEAQQQQRRPRKGSNSGDLRGPEQIQFRNRREMAGKSDDQDEDASPDDDGDDGGDDKRDDLSLFLSSADKQRQKFKIQQEKRDNGAPPDSGLATQLRGRSESRASKSTLDLAFHELQGNEANNNNNNSIRHKTAKVVRRAITLKTLVRNFSHRASSYEPPADGSASKDNRAPQAGSGNLLSAQDDGGHTDFRFGRKSADCQPTESNHLQSMTNRPASAIDCGRQGSAEARSPNLLPIKFRAAIFFRRNSNRRPSSGGDHLSPNRQPDVSRSEGWTNEPSDELDACRTGSPRISLKRKDFFSKKQPASKSSASNSVQHNNHLSSSPSLAKVSKLEGKQIDTEELPPASGAKSFNKTNRLYRMKSGEYFREIDLANCQSQGFCHEITSALD